MTAYVYPEKIKNVPPLENVQTFYEGENSTPKKGPFDVFNLGPYQLDESRRISWKHYARTGELLIKEGEELTQSLVHFRLTEDAFNKELVLSKITTQMLLCLQNEMAFTLETPHKKMGPGLTSKHLCDCLRELCRC